MFVAASGPSPSGPQARAPHMLVARLHGWLVTFLMTRHADPVRRLTGHVCAVIVLALGLIGPALGLLTLIHGGPGTSLTTLASLALPVALVPIWLLNRRGHRAGAAGLIGLILLQLAAGTAPASYVGVGGAPVVPAGFVVPVLLASFLIHPLAGLPVGAALVAMLGALAQRAQLPAAQVSAFVTVAALHLGFIALISGVISRAFATAVRTTEALAMRVEQRVIERTAALEAQRERTERLLAERKQLYSSVAHDLRNDVLTMVDMAEGLTDAWHSGDQEAIKAHERRLLRMVRRQAAYAQDLTDVSLVAEGQALPMRPGLVALAEVAVRLMDDLVLEARPHGVGLFVETQPGVPSAWCDPNRVERVLRNLIGNGIKAVRQSGTGGTVTVSFARDADDTLIRCEVRDTGAGIEPQDLARLGHRFVRVRLPGVQGDGLGIGLTLSAQLVSLMGGSLAISSLGRGYGATASFTVPAYAGQALEDEDDVELAREVR